MANGEQGRPATWDDYIRYEAKRAQVPESLALAVAKAESADPKTGELNPQAVSLKGARGIFQLMPDTAKELGVDIDDPAQNIRGGITYLRQQLDAHGGNVEKALQAYNWGPGNVASGSTPPQETQDYVKKIFGQLQGAATLPQPSQVGQPPPLRPLQTGQPAQPYETARTESFIGQPPPTGERRIGPAPSLATRASRYITPVVGAMAGGARGASIGSAAGPYGTAIGGVVGAGLGAGGGELLQAGWERLTGRPGIDQPPPSLAGTVQRVGEAATAGMAGEVGGQALTVAARSPIVRDIVTRSPVARAFVAPFSRSLKPTAQEAIRTFTTPAGKPLVLPSEVSQSKLLGLAENIASGSFTSGQRVAALQAERQAFAEQQVLDVLGTLGSVTEPRVAGEAVVSARKRAIESFRQGERALWEGQFMPAAETVPIATPRLDQFIAQAQGKEVGAVLPNAGMRAAEIVAEMTSGAGKAVMVGGKPMLPGDLNAALRAALVQAGQKPSGPQTAAAFQRTVSDLGKLSRSLEKAARIDPSKNNQLGLAKKLQQLAREDLEDSLSKSPQAHAAYLAATQFSRLGNERLFNESVRKIAREAPEKITAKLLAKNNSTAINAVKEAVDPQTFQGVQSAALDNILRENAQSGRISWAQVLRRLDSYGDDTLNALFPSGHAKDVQRVARLMESLKREKGTGSEAGMWIIRGGQAGAAASLLYGTAPVGSAAVLLTPPILARIMTSPKGIKWLTTGLSAPRGKAGARAASQILSFIERESRREEESMVGQPPPTGTNLTRIGQPPP